jgi:formiminotetrahydrofolate cyclodeaminase
MTISSKAPLGSVLDEIRQRRAASAGFTTALNGAAAAALGQAVLGISGGPTERMAEIVLALKGWADDDATALQKLLDLRAQGRETEGWELLQIGPTAMADLACEAAELLQAYRPQVIDHVRDDLEFAVVMLTGAARSAQLIVESNLRQWRTPALHAKFGPEVDRLAQRIGALSPVERIAWR